MSKARERFANRQLSAHEKRLIENIRADVSFARFESRARGAGPLRAFRVVYDPNTGDLNVEMGGLKSNLDTTPLRPVQLPGADFKHRA